LAGRKIEKFSERGAVRQKCLVIAYAVHETGRREVVGLDVGAAENRGVLAASFCVSCGPAALRGVRLCVSDCHEGLRARASMRAREPLEAPASSYFLRDGDRFFHIYSTFGRGAELTAARTTSST
jgi:hypothetical protein